MLYYTYKFENYIKGTNIVYSCLENVFLQTAIIHDIFSFNMHEERRQQVHCYIRETIDRLYYFLPIHRTANLFSLFQYNGKMTFSIIYGL